MQDFAITSIAAEIAGHLLVSANVEQVHQPGVEGWFAAQDIDTGYTRLFQPCCHLLEIGDLNIANGRNAFVEAKMTI